MDIFVCYICFAIVSMYILGPYVLGRTCLFDAFLLFVCIGSHPIKRILRQRWEKADNGQVYLMSLFCLFAIVSLFVLGLIQVKVVGGSR